MTCSSLREVACELALDLLYGEQRAAALAHLESCAGCRQEVALLTDTAEELLLLTPEVDPSPEFERRVLARIEELSAPDPVPSTRSAHVHTRRRVLALAAAVFLILAAVLVATVTPDRSASTRTAEMRSAAGLAVGTASLTDDPRSAVVNVPAWLELVRSYGATVDATYWIAVDTEVGAREVQRLPPADEHPWVVGLDVDPSEISSVSLVDNEGRVWCTARFAT
jgi:hypothetical protein